MKNEDADEFSAVESTRQAAAVWDAPVRNKLDDVGKERGKGLFPQSITVVMEFTGTGYVVVFGTAHSNGQYQATYILESVKRLWVKRELEDV